MKQALTIRLPLPHKQLGPNGGNSNRRGWVNSLAKDAKTGAMVEMRQAMQSSEVTFDGCRLIEIRWEWFPAARGLGSKLKVCCPMDEDNRVSATKAYADGIRDAIGVDDRWFRSVHVRRARTNDDSKFGGIIVTVTGVDS